MPHYYFHLAREDGRLDDEEGLKLPDAEAAWYQAARTARELIGGARALGTRWDAHAIEIFDDTGNRLDQVALADIAHYAL